MALKIFTRWVATVLLILAVSTVYQFNIGTISDAWSVIIQLTCFLSIFPVAYLSQTATAIKEERSLFYNWTPIDGPVNGLIEVKTKYYKLKFASFYKTGLNRWRVYQFENESFRIYHDTLTNKYYLVS